MIPLAVEDGLMRLAVCTKGAFRKVIPLVGWTANITQREITANSVMWKGKTHQLEHTTFVVLHAQSAAWFWRVHLRNADGTTIPLDVVYGQDLGLAHANAVTDSEAYVSQYKTRRRVEIVSVDRAGLPGGRDLLWHGWIAILRQKLSRDGHAYCVVDGFPSQLVQYEFAYISLQSRGIELGPGEERTIIFFAYYESDHPKASSEENIQQVLERISFPPEPAADPRTLGLASRASAVSTIPPCTGEMLSPTGCRDFFPGPWRHVEERDGKLHSFFHGESRHAVMRAKEALVERPHGHLLRSGNALLPEENILGTTVYAAATLDLRVRGGGPLSFWRHTIWRPEIMTSRRGRTLAGRHGRCGLLSLT